jgi:hypothetical protein
VIGNGGTGTRPEKALALICPAERGVVAAGGDAVGEIGVTGRVIAVIERLVYQLRLSLDRRHRQRHRRDEPAQFTNVPHENSPATMN